MQPDGVALRQAAAVVVVQRGDPRARVRLGPQGRVLVHWSGTEAKLRLLIEGPTEGAVCDGIAWLQTAARAELTVV